MVVPVECGRHGSRNQLSCGRAAGLGEAAGGSDTWFKLRAADAKTWLALPTFGRITGSQLKIYLRNFERKYNFELDSGHLCFCAYWPDRSPVK